MEVQGWYLQYAVQETLQFLCASSGSSLLLSALSWLLVKSLIQPSSYPERPSRQHFSISFSISFNNFTELSCINFILLFLLHFSCYPPLKPQNKPCHLSDVDLWCHHSLSLQVSARITTNTKTSRFWTKCTRTSTGLQDTAALPKHLGVRVS